MLGRLGTRFSLASDTPGVSTHVREMTELVMEEGNLHCQGYSRLYWRAANSYKLLPLRYSRITVDNALSFGMYGLYHIYVWLSRP